MKLTAKMQGVIHRLRTASRKEEQEHTRWQRWKKYWREEWTRVSHPRLYIASAVSAAVLFGISYAAINQIQHTSEWKQVYTDGTYVGMVPNDPKVQESMQQIALGYHVDLRFHNVHTDVPGDYDWQAVASLPTQAVAITSNGSPIVYTEDTLSATKVLAMVRQALAPKGVADLSQVQFVGNVAYHPVVVSASQVMSPDAAVRYILHPAHQPLAGRGTSLAVIAGVKDPVSTSKHQNQPLLQVSAEQTVSKEVTIPYETHYVKDNHLGVGKVSVVTPGKPGKAVEKIHLKYLNGLLVAQSVVQKEVVQEPVAEVAKKGTNAGVADGNWQWPSPYHDITSGFGWRSLGGGEMHPGVDIGCPVGTPIYASNNGVVEDAGWNSGGYGNWVKINNGNGIETVYGHMSRPVVHAGQTVAKGQLIGYSGATGHVTGPHLHYEVRIHGKPVPPTPYM